ncbi:hypothetical protein HYH03_010025 [Edaphochlamys debaryana]|uniref:Uncharacterized protein n=1 Tax=Edaphochlamys debaryana TaxID=47281 RepID=A0A835XXF6_9CHLO|nr:hypothetical protein HYH03_010025 [Edaphochlamys debaryana]|eukprot:KAG2491655.1 hypothetical protein HYH03_010025 [Edaphochlamys debaryana]
MKIRTSSPEAQTLFSQGMALAMQYNQLEAASSFRAAIHYDPKCAMCWWGLAYAQAPFQNKFAIRPPDDPQAAAMTPRYSRDDMDAAIDAASRAALLLGLAPLQQADQVAAAGAKRHPQERPNAANGTRHRYPSNDTSRRLFERLDHCPPSWTDARRRAASHHLRHRHRHRRSLLERPLGGALGGAPNGVGSGSGAAQGAAAAGLLSMSLDQARDLLHASTGARRQAYTLAQAHNASQAQNGSKPGPGPGPGPGPEGAKGTPASTPKAASTAGAADGAKGPDAGKAGAGPKPAAPGLEGGAKPAEAGATKGASGPAADPAADADEAAAAKAAAAGAGGGGDPRGPWVWERHYVAAMLDRLAVRRTYGEDWKWAEKRFAQDMADIAACWPQDPDAPALAAEALANLTPWDFWDPVTHDPRETTPIVLALIKEALDRNPRHPLASHLHIHVTEALPSGTDAPMSPELAEESADALRGLLPAMDHAQHMPSHNYARVGRWRDAVESNIASLRASLLGSRACLRSLYPDHNAQLLVFAAAMGGDGRRAAVYARVLKDLPRWIRDAPASLGGQWVAPLLVAVRFGDWGAVLATPPPPVQTSPLVPDPVWTPPDDSAGAQPDVALDPSLDSVLRYPPPPAASPAKEGGALSGPWRGPLNDTEYGEDGAEYARVVWHFARVMAQSAQLARIQDALASANASRAAGAGGERSKPASAAAAAKSPEALAAALAAGRKGLAAEQKALKASVTLVPQDQAVPPGPGLGVVVPGYGMLANVLDLMADARLAVLQSDWLGAIQALEQASKLEGGAGYQEPPRLGPGPARQCLGWVLLQSRRYFDAIQVYLADLRDYPHNPWSVWGCHASIPLIAKALESQPDPAINHQWRMAISDAADAVEDSPNEIIGVVGQLETSCPMLSDW